MKRSVGYCTVLFGLYVQTAFCDVLVTSENENEGSLCHLRNRTRGICRDFCNDPDQNWIEFKDDICNPRKHPTLYCCIDKYASNFYPTIYDVCMKSVLAENIERKRRTWRLTYQNLLDWYKENIEHRTDVIKETCNEAALKIEEDERQYFLRNCLKLEELNIPIVATDAEYRHIENPSIVGIGRTFDGGISWTCTGHFIHPLFVLTSAHCIADSQAQHHSSYAKYPNVVRFGRLDLFDEDFSRENPKSSLTYDIEEVLVMDQYNKDTLAGDIALLKVKRNLRHESKEEPHLKPIPACLWTKESAPTENLSILAYTSVFHKGTVSSTGPRECAKKLNIDELDKNRACYVCNLEDKNPMVASLHYSENLKINVPYLVGIGSSKMPCKGDEPAHFTMIAPYLNRIEEILSGNY